MALKSAGDQANERYENTADHALSQAVPPILARHWFRADELLAIFVNEEDEVFEDLDIVSAPDGDAL